jgi:hypothetical protein
MVRTKPAANNSYIHLKPFALSFLEDRRAYGDQDILPQDCDQQAFMAKAERAVADRL